jgi:hypothetical protein
MDTSISGRGVRAVFAHSIAAELERQAQLARTAGAGDVTVSLRLASQLELLAQHVYSLVRGEAVTRDPRFVALCELCGGPDNTFTATASQDKMLGQLGQGAGIGGASPDDILNEMVALAAADFVKDRDGLINAARQAAGDAKQREEKAVLLRPALQEAQDRVASLKQELAIVRGELQTEREQREYLQRAFTGDLPPGKDPKATTPVKAPRAKAGSIAGAES